MRFGGVRYFEMEDYWDWRKENQEPILVGEQAQIRDQTDFWTLSLSDSRCASVMS